MSDVRSEKSLFLSNKRREIFEALLKKKGIQGSSSGTISRRMETERPAPLSLAQERLWFLYQLDPLNPAYNLDIVIRIAGQLQIAALEYSFEELVHRHESLRTTLDVIDTQNVQVIAPVSAISLPLIDLTLLAEEEKAQEAMRLAKEATLAPFDLVQGPLLRVLVIRLERGQHLLLQVIHHIIADDWSITLFLREITRLYSGYVQGQAAPLPPLSIQYADYALWQRSDAQAALLERQLNYWQQQLKHAPLFELPTDHPRPTVQTYHGAEYMLPLSLDVTQALRRLSQQTEVTLFMLLVSVFSVLLMRYTSQDDIVIGTPVANRSRSELEELIGFFMNTLVLRINLADSPTFLDLLAHVRNITLDAYTHQELPFEKLVEVLQPERDLSRSPLFQIMFTLRNEREDVLSIPGLKLEPVALSLETAKVDVSLEVIDNGRQITCCFKYNTDLFEAETIAGMASHWQKLLEGVTLYPDMPLIHLPLLIDKEEQQIAGRWKETQYTYAPTCIHHQIEQQVKQTPAAPALVFKHKSLSYQELNQQANHLARLLQSRGVGPDVRVGICMERSLEMVVGLLAILKAGGAYVPIDPTYPVERVAMMIEDANVLLILTHQAVQDQLELPDQQVICLESDWATIVIDEPENVESAVSPDNLAYVMYTSGSTGKPKGVMVSHQNVANFFVGMDHQLGQRENNAWLAVTSISFDISALELFWTLTRGFKVVIQPDQKDISLFPRQPQPHTHSTKDIQFSLFYFADSATTAQSADPYRLLLEGARFADQHGFAAVWTPERHFHSFGGLYPNPSVIGAALAASTEHIHIRAGSVVLPLHNPLRIVEEWSVVDNISHGRVGISFASGWHANDFVLLPENYAQRREMMAQKTEVVRKLWRGESIQMKNGVGKEIDVQVFPRPIQSELPIWVTAGGSPETFRMAGATGSNLLTHLLGQSLEELAEKITLYRQAYQQQSVTGGTGHVTLMLHTFVGQDDEEVRELVREPFCAYLKSSLNLIQALAISLGYNDLNNLSDDDMSVLLGHAFDRYYHTSGLLGTPQSCLPLVNKLKEIGVDEIACLIDFGVDTDQVLEHLSYLDMLRQLAHGEVQPEADASLYAVAEQIRRQQITHLQCTPSLATLLTNDEYTLQALAQLDEILIGGEAFPPALAQQLGSAVSARIQNMYGPTETTIWSAIYNVKPTAEGQIPIGSALANTQIYILDRFMQPLPQGMPGEVYIGGDGVVRGYLARPELTAERFVPDPFGSHAGGRLYRTGDMARYRTDGMLEYLGRCDQQVKLRGLRIEPGEIEALLGQHPSVRESVVVVCEVAPQDKRLVGYVVLKEGATFASEKLREFLRARLPEYMLPAAFVCLDALPLTPNGKVSRKDLPAYIPAEQEDRGDLDVPRTPIEEILVDVWSEMLGMKKVGTQQNFFDLGGHSLLATQLISRVRKLFQVEVPLRRLFEAPTVAGFSQYIEQCLHNDNVVQPALVPVSREQALPLSFAQQRLWFLSELEPNSSLYNVPAALIAHGAVFRMDILEQCLHELVQRHEILRTSFTVHAGQPVQRMHSDVELDVPVIDVSALTEEEQLPVALQLVTRESQRPFHLHSDVLLRCIILKLSVDKHVIAFNMHHIVSDAWSRGLFVQELSSLYKAFLAKHPSPFSPLNIQYADFAVWQRNWLQGEILDQHLAYWRKQLAGAKALELVTDYPRTAIQSYQGANKSIQLSADLLTSLASLSRQEGVTLFMLLLTSFQTLLYRVTGQEDVIVGTDIANRTHAETEALIGFFVNLLALRTDFKHKLTFRALLARVRESVLEAYAHQDLPFEVLVQHMPFERNHNRNPLVNVLFVLQNVPMHRIELPGVELEALPLEETNAKFDLAVFLMETPDGLRGHVNYSTDLFKEETIAQLMHQYEVLLQSILAQPDMPVDMLEIYSEAEKQQHEQQEDERRNDNRKRLRMSRQERVQLT